MHVMVKLFTQLVSYVAGAEPGVPFKVELYKGNTLVELLKQLNLPQSEVKVAFVNGRAQPLDFQLHNGDEVGLFPLIGGG